MDLHDELLLSIFPYFCFISLPKTMTIHVSLFPSVLQVYRNDDFLKVAFYEFIKKILL